MTPEELRLHLLVQRLCVAMILTVAAALNVTAPIDDQGPIALIAAFGAAVCAVGCEDPCPEVAP